MINTFCCPSLLESHELDDPKHFENIHIKSMMNLKNLCSAHSKTTKILKQSVDRYKLKAPWTKMADPTWRMYLLDWQEAIFPFLERSLIDINHNDETETCDLLEALEKRETNAWGYLLEHIYDLTMENCTPVVVSNLSCAKTRCRRSEIVNCINFAQQIHLVLYPWLGILDSRLPATGDYPFIPVKDWDKCGNVYKGDKNGFVDSAGNQWVHDTERKDHWDVQLDDGSHINVSYEGRVI